MLPLTVDSLNPSIKNVQYGVGVELAIKAEAYRVQLQESQQSGSKSQPELPFEKVISSNIGNPQQRLDQPPITFVRQVGVPLPLSSFHNC
jgi:alanine transaminase